MKIGLPFIFMLICLHFVSHTQSTATIEGIISLPSFDKFIKKTKLYNVDGSDVMHSDDPLSKMENNVIISVHNLSAEIPFEPTPNAKVTQQQQTFLPHVLPVTLGTTVYLLNEDEFFHNIYSLTPGSRFNIGRRPPGNPYPIVIERTGPIHLACDIHPHMDAIVLSLDTPFFTRINPDGSFLLENLPSGNYRLEVYHPLLKKRVEFLELKDGESRQVLLDYSQTKP